MRIRAMIGGAVLAALFCAAMALESVAAPPKGRTQVLGEMKLVARQSQYIGKTVSVEVRMGSPRHVREHKKENDVIGVYAKTLDFEIGLLIKDEKPKVQEVLFDLKPQTPITVTGLVMQHTDTGHLYIDVVDISIGWDDEAKPCPNCRGKGVIPVR
ncbi:MAG: hypothetical protein FJ272_00970 [Planctomycetes bacterium]|nr:hypothetical protein [Planctomycetota bacterium]MBM4083342.1 hypothetical protein [Planctomycetota bacterium]